MSGNSNKPSWQERALSWGIGVCVAFAFTLVALGFVAGTLGYQKYRQEGGANLTDLGNLGSYLQGTVASFWSLAGVFLILVAFLVQKQQLQCQQEELELTRGDAEEQRKHLQAQNRSVQRQIFENSFFQLLALHNEIVSELRQRHVGPGGHFEYESVGRKCFQKWYEEFKKIVVPGEKKDDEERYLRLYADHQGELGHYFRNLYHVIKFVKNSEVDDKRRYASLVRSTMSQYEQVLLFYNCLSPQGAKFKPMVEEFGLLENLDRRLLLSEEDAQRYDARAYK